MKPDVSQRMSLSSKKRFHNALTQLSDHIISKKRNRTLMGKVPFDQHCLVVKTSLDFYLNLSPTITIFQGNLEGSVDLFMFSSSQCGHIVVTVVPH